MIRIVPLVLFSTLFVPLAFSATPAQPPLRVGIVGLVHGHVHGFLAQSRHSPEIEIVGVAEPDARLLSQAAARYGFDRSIVFADLEEMLQKVHPQAVLVYTNTYDHRRVVEICARHGVHVMMEKPLAVGLEDALAIEKAAHTGKIHVLVNYETSWYRSNHAAYDLVHEGALGEVRKVVVHDGHNGPKEIGGEPEFLAWLTDPKLNGGGALFDFGCYGADLMTWLMDGLRPQTVTAVTQQLKRHRATDIDARVREVLQLVGLTGKETRRPAQLSGGERQRVALARSLVLQPGVLLLDEPLAALDPKLRKQMRVELQAMQRRAGVTFLLVTHDQEEALSMSDHLAVMNEGRIEQVGSPEDVYLPPRSRFVAGFLGAINWISGAGIRPEAVRLLPAGEVATGEVSTDDATPHRRVPGVVTGTVFLGDCVHVMVRLHGGEDTVAQLPRRAALFQPGDAVQFTWSAADEMTFP